MFDKILIANRGEIACRVMRTARSLGIRTVAVYSDADASALHVQNADEAVRLGPAPVADSYLRGDLIIAAALQTGAEAIHPGYGFLSENPDFVDAVTAAGLVFIGPSATAIRAMGLKDAAKALMEKAGVPVVPGYHGDIQEAAHLAQMADQIGYPVLIKAVAGGGGKGMRLVDRPDDFLDALASARAEARTAFGNDAVLVEKYILSPRHIEIQVFGDGQDAVHLFERDCSLQRRHQKVIEEAPAPGMTPQLRTAMGEAAVRAAKAIGYSGAGTVEFIVDGSGPLRPDGFWFMEMNTRLQVEHPVTEAITGVDLVDWQLRVAAGARLPCTQQDLTITGHAFEARLYAEDPANGFLPVTGRLEHLVFAPDTRADTGVRAGDVISPWYDPMIAKIVVHGPDRATALRLLSRALEETQVAGTVTNLNFLSKLSRHKGFRQGEVDTGLIGRDLIALTARPGQDDIWQNMAAIAALTVADIGTDAQVGFALWRPPTQWVAMMQDDHEVTVQIVVQDATSAIVTINDRAITCHRSQGAWHVQGTTGITTHPVAGGVHVFAVGRHESFRRVDPLARSVAAGATSHHVEAPMPGLVRDIAVKAGTEVKMGDRLVVLEAMKMEHVLRAPRDGIIDTVTVLVGAQVEAGAILILLTPEG